MPNDTITRRDVVQTLGAATAVSLAGCGQGGGGGNQELGERVPRLVMEYWAGKGPNTKMAEDMAPAIKDGVEGLGLTLEVKGVPFGTQVDKTLTDQRGFHFLLGEYVTTPARLDPERLLQPMRADWAGGQSGFNPAQWVNCDYMELYEKQKRETDQEKRRELVNQCQELISKEAPFQATTALPIIGAYRTDKLNLSGVGEMGIYKPNVFMFGNSTGKGGTEEASVRVSPNEIQPRNWPTLDSSLALYMWANLVHSPLVGYDQNFNSVNVLAESFEINGNKVEITLKDNLTFHDGVAITSEDVKFTFEQYAHGASEGVYSDQFALEFETINVIDDRNLEVVFSEPRPTFRTFYAPFAGILHSELWKQGGAQESPGDFDFDPPVGSGFYQIKTWDAGSFVRVTPFKDHPLVREGKVDPKLNYVFQAFRSEEAAIRAVQNGEIELVPGVSPSNEQRILGQENIETSFVPGWTPFYLIPQTSAAPGKFTEFRRAVAATINRQRVSQLAMGGKIPPEKYNNNNFPHTHPWHAPEDMLEDLSDVKGNIKKGRRMLEEASWGWDNNDQLHYPPDSDLSPLWAAGEKPNPEEYPCLE